MFFPMDFDSEHKSISFFFEETILKMYVCMYVCCELDGETMGWWDDGIVLNWIRGVESLLVSWRGEDRESKSTVEEQNRGSGDDLAGRGYLFSGTVQDSISLVSLCAAHCLWEKSLKSEICLVMTICILNYNVGLGFGGLVDVAGRWGFLYLLGMVLVSGFGGVGRERGNV